MLRLLICDDHPAIRTALRLLAKEAAGGCDATEAASAGELVQALQGRQVFDLLVLDLKLPDRPGLAVLADVRRLRPDLPVIVLAADESGAVAAEALRLGATQYLSKSVSERVLFNVFRDAMRESHSYPMPLETIAGPESIRVRPGEDLELSGRQKDVLECLMKGQSAKEIARTLGIAEGTVKSHTVAVFRALNVSSRSQVVVAAHRRGISFGT